MMVSINLSLDEIRLAIVAYVRAQYPALKDVGEFGIGHIEFVYDDDEEEESFEGDLIKFVGDN